MRSDVRNSVIAALLTAALSVASGCGGEPDVNAETLGTASESAAPAAETETTSAQTTVATDEIFLTTLEPISAFSFRKGVWLAKGEDVGGLGAYWFVTGNGDIYYSFRENGSRGKIIYELDGNDGAFYSGGKVGEGSASRFSVTENGDTVRLTYTDSGHVTVLEYVSDDLDAWFRQYPDDEPAELTADDVLPFRRGVWLDMSGLYLNHGRESTGLYWIFDRRVAGNGGSVIGVDTGIRHSFAAEKSGDNVILDLGMGDLVTVKFTVIDENNVDVTFIGDGSTERLTFVTDDADDFTFICDEELVILAKKYYAAKHDGHVPTKAEASAEDDRRVLIQLYDDDSYSLNATSAWYFIDRFTGKGEDIDGREIDLADVADDVSGLKTGIWWLRDKDYGGEIWVIQDNKAGYGKELINGIGFDFTYVLDGNSGVFHYNGVTRVGDESFVLSDDGSEITFAEPDNERKLVWCGEKSDGFGVYDNASLVELANEYYAAAHGGQYPAKSDWSIEDDDRVLIQLYDKNDTVTERYFIDRFTAKGVDGNGNEVFLAKTEETAENTAADENNTYGG